jgi:drug/metabolite transporter (DMT)-like permease
MVIAQSAGLAVALAAAVAWGGSDFSGGVASRKSGALGVLVLSRVSFVLALAALAVTTRDPLPPLASSLWAAGAGISGAAGVGVLYKGLAIERSALVMPTAGVVGAAIPVLFGALIEGLLPLPQQVGLLVALLGIWLVSEGHRIRLVAASRGLALGVLAGCGFGGFYILLGQVESGPVFTPLAVAGIAGSLVAALALAVCRGAVPSPRRNPAAIAAGTLDAIGAVLYLLAIRLIRLDVAAVLSSLYPAFTVLFFRAVLKERVAVAQWVGLATCVIAIALIAL